ncbi:uncharacterized protein TNCV_4612321 [Trichonephila clavipes]|nr:uncharacterized protein TNCV_4612321 [Trichonephila clavipes]
MRLIRQTWLLPITTYLHHSDTHWLTSASLLTETSNLGVRTGWTQKTDNSFGMAVGSLVVRASDSRPEGLGSMLDVTKYPPSAHGFTCRNCGGGDRGRVAIYRPFGEVSLSLNRTVTCMVLKANDRRTSSPCHDEFRGPRSDYVRQFYSDSGQTAQRFLPIKELECDLGT